MVIDGSQREFINFSPLKFTFFVHDFPVLGLQNTPEWFPYLISVIALMLSVIIAQFIIVPQQRTKSMKMDMEGSQGDGLTTAIALDSGRNWQIVNGLFNLLQILSAVFTSFAHGGEFLKLKNSLKFT